MTPDERCGWGWFHAVFKVCNISMPLSPADTERSRALLKTYTLIQQGVLSRTMLTVFWEYSNILLFNRAMHVITRLQGTQEKVYANRKEQSIQPNHNDDTKAFIF